MNRFIKLANVCILLLFSGSCLAVPLVKLIISPCDFNEKKVVTSGFLGMITPFEPSSGRLFLTIDDFKFNNFEQSIMIKIPDEIALKKELYNKRYIIVSGAI